jgi:hypothetical protein
MLPFGSRKTSLFSTLAALILAAVPATAAAQTTPYTSEAAFQSAAGTLTLVDWDVDDVNCPIFAPSPGVLAGSFYTGDGLSFSAGVIFGEPNLPFSGRSAPNIISNSGVNTPTPALVDGTFATTVTAVGIWNTAAQSRLLVYDTTDNLLGSITSDTDATTDDFLGLVSTTPIKRFEFTFVSGIGFGGDDLQFTHIATPTLTDPDLDGIDSSCDPCPNDPTNDGSDGDGVCDDIDNCVGLANPTQANADGDALGNSCDPDDDNDGVADNLDPVPLNPNLCGDSDADSCDDCAIGTDNFGPLPDVDPANDGADSDADGQCNLSDPDDDNDGCLDGVDDNPVVASGDTDGDGTPDDCDADDDNDGVDDASDVNSLNPNLCEDADADSCDDCAIGVDGFGPAADGNPANDGTDTDSDGLCNTGDPDDDNDGVADGGDLDAVDPSICADADGDLCDDCAIGVDGLGPLPDNTPANDGTDTDSDGLCNAGDPDDDNDGVADSIDPSGLDPDICGDQDNDLCDDCTVGTDDLGPIADNQIGNDGIDTDADGQCDVGDPDDDNDGVTDAADTASLDPTVCEDSDGDSCDDCSVGSDGFGPLPDHQPGNDGLDTDSDGLCDAGDPDDDNDGVADGADSASTNPDLCEDADADGCDDCATGTDDLGPLPDNDPANDGPDADGDGVCDLTDNCAVDVNPRQADVDADGNGDLCDACPDDASDICDPDFTTATECTISTPCTVTSPNGQITINLPGCAMLTDGASLSTTQSDAFLVCNNDLDCKFSVSITTDVPLNLDPGCLAEVILAWSPGDVDENLVAIYKDIYGGGIFDQVTNACLDPSDGCGTGGCEFGLPPGICETATCCAVTDQYTMQTYEFSVFALYEDGDLDDDGVRNEVDLCPDTVLPEDVPFIELNPNHWAVGESGDFETASSLGGGNGSSMSFTLQDTHGCSCEQILSHQGRARGQFNYGCATGTMLSWIQNNAP